MMNIKIKLNYIKKSQQGFINYIIFIYFFIYLFLFLFNNITNYFIYIKNIF